MRALAALALIAASPCAAETKAPPPVAAASIDFPAGKWAGEGIIFGRASKVTLTIEPILNGKGAMLDYRVEMAGGAFSGRALYRTAESGKWEGRWLDSAGMFRDLSAVLTTDRITVTWGSPATEIGRTVYALEGQTLVLTDQVLRASGQFETFATARLTRK